MSLPQIAHGAALFADISGFTALTEALVVELGPQRGAEELTATIDAVFAELLGELDRYGGDVIYFSGDAVTCWLDGDDGLRAVSCAFAMQSTIARVGVRTTAGGRRVTLGLKVAVAVGSARRFVVGVPEIQLLDVLAGSLMDRLAEAEHQARQGEVVLDPSTAARLSAQVEIAESGPGRDGVVVAAGVAVPVPIPPARPPLPQLPDSVVRQWLLPTVFRRMSAGRGEFLADLRPAVPLFLRFEGIDFDSDPASAAKLDDFVVRAQRVVDVNGGNVLQLTIGDKGAYLYAVFGAPVAHEDDATRACASACALLALEGETAATGLQIGVASGRLRSGTYGHHERRTFACLGDAVNLAARLMAAAPPGQVYVSAEVRRAAGTGFEWAEARLLQVKGKTSAVSVSALLGVRRQSSGRGGANTPDSALLGRASELAALQGHAEAALAGHGALVAVSGDAGIGKSRLLAELGAWLGRRRVAVHAGVAASFGVRPSYGAWHDIWRSVWDIDIDATPDAVAAQLTDAIMAADPELVARLPLLGAVLGVALPDTSVTVSFDAKLRKTSLESLVVRYLEAATAKSPLVLIIDNSQYLDAMSLDLIEAIRRGIRRSPLLLLMSGRTRDAPDLHTPPSTRPADTIEVRLGELDEPSSRLLVENAWSARTGVPPSEIAPSVMSNLIARAGGNPFHLEQLVNYLADRGLAPNHTSATDLALPSSLHSLVLTRVDDLAEGPRRTLKVASVVGMRFDTGLVCGAYPELGPQDEVRSAAAILAANALVASDPVPPAYVFRNTTTQEVTYESLPFATRSSLHGRIGTWLEEHNAAGTDRILDLLAHHFGHGTDAAKKRDYLVRAGIAAQQAYANDAAVQYLSSAVPLVPDNERAELQRRLGKVLEIRGDWTQAQQTYESALERYLSDADELGVARTRTDLAEVARKQGRFAAAHQHLVSADRAFAAVDDADGHATVLHLQGTLASQQGRYDEARTAYQASLDIRTRLEDRPKIGALLSNLAVVAECVGDYEAARDLNEQALRVRESVGDLWAIAVSRNNLGMIALLQQDYAGARVHIEESMRLAGVVGDPWVIAVGQHNLGNAHRGLDEPAEAGAALATAWQTYRDYDDRWSLALLLEDLLPLAIRVGRPVDAFALLGVADQLRVELEAPRPPASTATLDAELAGPRLTLGARTDEAYARGREMNNADIDLLVHFVCFEQ